LLAEDETGFTLRTQPDTDFWQRTHYGFRRDNGHCLLKPVTGDFAIQVKTTFQPEAQYDQCGLFARVDGENWIKCSTEFEDARHSRLGSVVTNLGYSDWASQDIATVDTVWYRMSRRGDDFLIEHSADGEAWRQMRICHLHHATETLHVGVYACSPVGEGFTCTFSDLSLGPNRWTADGHG
jgi:hypothetical protein